MTRTLADLGIGPDTLPNPEATALLRAIAEALDAPTSGLGRAIVRDLLDLADELAAQ